MFKKLKKSKKKIKSFFFALNYIMIKITDLNRIDLNQTTLIQECLGSFSYSKHCTWDAINPLPF